MAFVLWPNIILFVCVGVVLSIIGYIFYGMAVGFDNTLKDFENAILNDIKPEINAREGVKTIASLATAWDSIKSSIKTEKVYDYEPKSISAQTICRNGSHALYRLPLWYN